MRRCPRLRKLSLRPATNWLRLAGDYESQSYWARLEVNDGELTAVLSGQPLRLSATAPLEYLADGRIMTASPFHFEQDEQGRVNTFTAADQRFVRVDADRASRAEAWQAFVGKYGQPFIPLVISIRHGHLYATIENEYDYRLTLLNRVTFALPPGMYADEQIVFQTDAGRPRGRRTDGQHVPAAPRGLNARLRPAVRMDTLIKPDDTWLLWTVITGGVALAIWLEQRYTWAARSSGPVLALCIAMLLSNLRRDAARVRRSTTWFTTNWCPLALPLLLFRANVLHIVRSTGWLFVAFHISAAGTVAGALAAAAVLRDRVPEVAQVAGIMTGSYTGGGVNFFAVASSYEVSGNVTGPLLVADNFIMAGMFMTLLLVCGSRWVRRHYPHPHTADAVDSRQLAAEHWRRKEISLLDIAGRWQWPWAVVALARITSDARARPGSTPVDGGAGSARASSSATAIFTSRSGRRPGGHGVPRRACRASRRGGTRSVPASMCSCSSSACRPICGPCFRKCPSCSCFA